MESEGSRLIVRGPSGTGKPHLAVAHRAIQNGSDTLFSSATDLGRNTQPNALVITEVAYFVINLYRVFPVTERHDG